MLYQQSTLLKMWEGEVQRKKSEEFDIGEVKFDMTLDGRWEGRKGIWIDNSTENSETIGLEMIIFESRELCNGIHHHVLLYNGLGC